MFVTIVICTYRRAADVEALLNNLTHQLIQDFEVLVVDGSGEHSAVRDLIERWTESVDHKFQFSIIASPTGLTRQRNVGLQHARGELICFLDDDVTVDDRFVEQISAIFTLLQHNDVGGITGYDTLNYPSAVTSRWRLRKLLRVVRSLQVGDADHLGRNVPLSFAKPFSGFLTVGWLPGYCMVYRRAALENLIFDEQLPTYGGEDRDFSLRVGEQWRLLFCGDLHFQHHLSKVNRVAGTRQIYQTAFGIGRGFRKRARSHFDILTIITYALREFLIESLSGLKTLTRAGLCAPFVRVYGLLAGWHSLSPRDRSALVSSNQARMLSGNLASLSKTTVEVRK